MHIIVNFHPKPCLLQVIYLKYLFETLKKHVLFKIVAVVRSTNSPKFLNNTITVILHCNYTVIILQLRLHYVNVVLTTTVLSCPDCFLSFALGQGKKGSGGSPYVVLCNCELLGVIFNLPCIWVLYSSQTVQVYTVKWILGARSYTKPHTEIHQTLSFPTPTQKKESSLGTKLILT